ncbi:UPF0187-domain-containing protein [Punctularia strigosozonata HHB-11173 SS5]|uniref:UPF0187-domain-containing protein n=1 Tax=Punctularia strigosozonata (strain HHB-11173) TaxID=741275 RepID=UPI0004416B8E|nr:UPF0187-domain-containing protein [Punctularia strigosozonata HHB-11173 SS5]EIN06373.1 UPF0187-domain-containing protein [Punctularia strigosozonata HHB-11173 SS5]
MSTVPTQTTSARISGKRSFTGQHRLLPASEGRAVHLYNDVLLAPRKTFLRWTFGRDTVIWRIWPAVLLHTTWAAVVVSVSLTTSLQLNIPPILLTVLGVVIGFVISYRAMSGYDRYWTGRTYWSDLMRNSRTLGRLIWFHVPPILTPKTQEENDLGVLKRSPHEMHEVMVEKRLALDLIEGFAVAMKHHLRSEMGIYYEDLYHLVQPLHEHEHNKHHRIHRPGGVDAIPGFNLHPPSPSETFESDHPPLKPASRKEEKAKANSDRPSSSRQASDEQSDRPRVRIDLDPVIPPINAYGTFNGARPSLSRAPSSSGDSCSSDEGQPHGADGERRMLLPSNRMKKDTMMSKIESDLIPFSSIIGPVVHFLGRPFARKKSGDEETPEPAGEEGGVQRKWSHAGEPEVEALTHQKHRPRIAGGGENLPVDILRCLSEWMSVLEARGTVPGTSLGSMIGTLAAFEDTLSGLERILTTPLPFVYSVHIRHTVWVYLFFLPFQLLDQFYWYSIFGVAIAAFIYLGFLAAGEEIEQPFGYDENDLDLDLFCKHVVHADIDRLKRTPCVNVWFGSYHATLVDAGREAKPELDKVFGHVEGDDAPAAA